MTVTHVFPQVVVPFILHLVSYSVCSFDDHNRRNPCWLTSIGRAFSGFSATTNSERRYEGDRNALWLSSHIYLEIVMALTSSQVFHSCHHVWHMLWFTELLLCFFSCYFDCKASFAELQSNPPAR